MPQTAIVLNWILGVSIFLLAVTLHELAHGYVAHRLGDDTARMHGRLTLNPFKHIDLFWTVILPVLMFYSTGGRFAIGQAKPVPVNFQKLKWPRMGMVLVAVAGPAANFILAVIAAMLFHYTQNDLIRYLGVYLNVGLGVFNLIPIPPLDGSRVVTAMLPKAWARLYGGLERYGFLLVIVLYYFGFLSTIVITGIFIFCRLFQIPV